MTRATRSFRRVVPAIVAGGIIALLPAAAYAALCVWRNPDQDIKRFFGGGTYRTVTVRVGGHKGTIEQRVGTRLDPDETELRFWPVIKDGKRVGTVSTHLGRGDYGAIEVIIALEDVRGRARVKQVAIQRDRERHREQLRSPRFLNQFVGKTAADPIQVGRDIRAAHSQALQGSRVVALSVKKMLVAYDVLGIGNR